MPLIRTKNVLCLIVISMTVCSLPKMEGEMTCSLIVIWPPQRPLKSSSTQQLDNGGSTRMATQIQERDYTTIELLTPYGPEFRRALKAPARPPRDDEIPIIDLAGLDGDLEAKKRIAERVQRAAENTGFFYVENHGIDQSLVDDALSQAKAFFAQSPEQKEQLLPKYPGLGVGYRGIRSTQINHAESRGASPTVVCSSI